MGGSRQEEGRAGYQFYLERRERENWNTLPGKVSPIPRGVFTRDNESCSRTFHPGEAKCEVGRQASLSFRRDLSFSRVLASFFTMREGGVPPPPPAVAHPESESESEE